MEGEKETTRLEYMYTCIYAGGGGGGGRCGGSRGEDTRGGGDE